MNPQAEVPWHPADYIWNPVRLNAVPACEGLPVPEALPHVSAAAVAAAGFAASMRYQGSGLAPLSGLDTSLDPRHRSRSSTVCQVEGCNGSLKQLKEYHQRYKICEHHLKVSSIIREGVRQRFCQQCGRFHDLSEFDGDKRSCRARLQRHNARRRKKADGDSALRVSVTSRKPSGTGSRRQSTSPTSRDQSGSGRATGRHSARQIAALLLDNATAISSGHTLAHRHSDDMDGSGELPNGNGIVNGLGNGLVPVSAPPPMSAEDWANGGSAGSASRPRGGQKLPNLENALSELLTDSQARHQGSAVSLEAIQEFLDDGQRQNGHYGLGPMPFAQTSGNFGMMPMGSAFPENSGVSFGGLPMSNSLPNANDLWGMRKQAFQAGGNLSLPPGMGLGGDSSMGFSSGMTMGGGGSNGASPVRLHHGLHSMGSAPLPMEHKVEAQGSGGLGGGRLPPLSGVRSLSDQSVLAGSSEDGGRQQVGPNSVLHNARALLSGDGMNGAPQEELTSHGPGSLGYPAGQQLVRVATKLFNCTPDQLPPDLQQNLVSLLSCGNSMQGYIRPGCTHLTLDAVLDQSKARDLRRAGVRSVAQALLAGPTGAFWLERTFTLQLFDEVALVRGGRVLSVLSASGSLGVFPSVLALSPRFLAPGEEGPLLALTGANLGDEGAAVLARCNGTFLPLETVARVPSEAGPGAPESVVVRLPADTPPGAVQLEVTRSGCLSGAAPTLVLPSAQAAAELRTLEEASVRGEELEAIILDLDRVLQYDAVLQASVTGAPPPPAQALRPYTPEDVAAVCECAQRLLILACDQGWPAVAATVLPVACAAANTVGEVMDALQERMAAGLTPLHLAVRSRSAELVELLLGWASAGGYEWSVNVPGPNGISPLHLSALLPDNGAIAHLLTGSSSTGRDVWFTSRADDGSTPADWAEARVNELVRTGTLEEDMDSSSDVDCDAGAAAGPSAASSSATGDVFMEEVIQKPHMQAGKEEAQRGKECGGGPEMPPRLYEDYYQDCDALAFAPTVFDRTSSTVTASVILLVGGATLLLRHFVDVLAL